MSGTIDQMAQAEEIRELREENARLRSKDAKAHRGEILAMRHERLNKIKRVAARAGIFLYLAVFVSATYYGAGRIGYDFGRKDTEAAMKSMTRSEKAARKIAAEACDQACRSMLKQGEIFSRGFAEDRMCFCYHGKGMDALTGDVVPDKVYQVAVAVQRDLARLKGENP
jgi:hypothetical protein